MKIKTSTRISIIFSIFTFFVVFIVIISLNIVSFFGWYNEEKEEIIRELDNEYLEIKENYNDFDTQKKEIQEDVEELGGVIEYNVENSDFLNKYKKIIFEIYYEDKSYYIIHKKETEFGNIFIPYEITTHFQNQIFFIKYGIIILFIITLFSFLLLNLLFTKLALKDIFYISKQLKNIDLNNIEKIKLDLNKNDEINIIVNSINNFLTLIEQNTQSLKDFNSQVSHEFKTPLMVISSELEYLSLSGKDKQSYEKIEKQIDILNELLETFLFISKIENFRGEIKKENIDFLKIIGDKIDSLNILYKEKNIKIDQNLNKIKLISNKKLLDALIKNLLDNAFKYNKKGGKISIKLTNKYLLIKDNGIGIQKENLNKIFDSFYRLDEDNKGYGVGLNIVKKIVNILGYKIEVKSVYGKGSEFKILFK